MRRVHLGRSSAVVRSISKSRSSIASLRNMPRGKARSVVQKNARCGQRSLQCLRGGAMRSMRDNKKRLRVYAAAAHALLLTRSTAHLREVRCRWLHCERLHQVQVYRIALRSTLGSWHVQPEAISKLQNTWRYADVYKLPRHSTASSSG